MQFAVEPFFDNAREPTGVDPGCVEIHPVAAHARAVHVFARPANVRVRRREDEGAGAVEDLDRNTVHKLPRERLEQVIVAIGVWGEDIGQEIKRAVVCANRIAQCRKVASQIAVGPRLQTVKCRHSKTTGDGALETSGIEGEIADVRTVEGCVRQKGISERWRPVDLHAHDVIRTSLGVGPRQQVLLQGAIGVQAEFRWAWWGQVKGPAASLLGPIANRIDRARRIVVADGFDVVAVFNVVDEARIGVSCTFGQSDGKPLTVRGLAVDTHAVVDPREAAGEAEGELVVVWGQDQKRR